MPIPVPPMQSPSGMLAAGQYGTGILTVSVPRGDAAAALGRLLGHRERDRREHGNTMDRNEWRLVLHVHLADPEKDAVKPHPAPRRPLPPRSTAKAPPARRRRTTSTSTRSRAHFAGSGAWCVGTPDDLIAKIE